MTAPRTWLITGVSRGLGRALAEAALARGDTVVGTTRSGTADLAPGSGILHILPFELADAGAVASMVARAFSLAGHIDVLVNNAGYTLLGALEDASDAEVERLFSVNVFAPLRVIRAALPRLRAQGRGHIVNITSVQGRDPSAGVGVYAASKSAMDALTQALALEIEPLGLRATAVAPGGLRTEFLSDRSVDRSSGSSVAAYPSVGAALDRFRTVSGQQAGDPHRAAAAIIAIVDAKEPPRRLLLGSDAIDRARRSVEDAEAERARWETLSRSTDVPEAGDA
ncbi:SDR family NAD(P)-dependent oxidoreductase [Aureimonas sp. OT7]|uniref:SDR family NAD(P)-dependent oxidoreductase n=1 Tax=Aureimonas sp. OT7 TaxID=2816454 RepID=UPI00177C353E|nr:SDR family NAD(P)-dependent oxidoreductase [Aureimonas sp. OT7]QOG07386.1 SDR family NAD(P)-dependent oxidoreductase [Aureimonas sp. OT7]